MPISIWIRIGCLPTLCLGASALFAQQAGDPTEGGPVLTFGINSTVSVVDNYSLRPGDGDSATLFDSKLSFSYLDQRANDTLRLDLDGVLRAIEPPGRASSGDVLDDPRIRLSYNRQSANSRLNVSAEYRQTSVDFLDPFDRDRFFANDPLDERDLTQDQGNREQIATRFGFETGLNDPIGFTLEGRYLEQSYSDTTDPALFDSRTLGLTGTTRFDLSPVSTALIVLRYEDYSADDALRTDRLTSSLSLGFTTELTKVDTLDVSIGYQNIEEQNLLGSTSTKSGVIGGVNLTRELTLGTIGAGFDLRESVNGSVATLIVERAMPLPLGTVDFSLGVTRDVTGTLSPVGSINFIHEMPRSTLTASLDRQVTTSALANELRVTQASLGYAFEVNSLSNITLLADFAEISQAGGPAVTDTTRVNLSATYSRDLTRDWRFSSGYEYRMVDEDGRDTATSNRVFVTVGREFVMRP